MKANAIPLPAVLLALLLAALPDQGSSAQTTGQKNQPLVISSMYGRDLFEFYCANCHGRDGRGGGAVAATLKVPPPDLTKIAMRHGGIFSNARVEALITGDQDRLSVSHGSKDMPVWGPIFQALDPSDTKTRIRIANIVGYLESIQDEK